MCLLRLGRSTQFSAQEPVREAPSWALRVSLHVGWSLWVRRRMLCRWWRSLTCQRMQASGLTSSSLATATRLSASTPWSLIAPSSMILSQSGAPWCNVSPRSTSVAFWTSSTASASLASTLTSSLCLLLLLLWLLLLLPLSSSTMATSSVLSLTPLCSTRSALCRRFAHICCCKELQMCGQSNAFLQTSRLPLRNGHT